MGAIHANDLKKSYAKVAPGYAKTHQGDVDLPNLEKFVAQLPPEAQVLDLGAGNGRDSQWLSEHGCQVTMFDLSPDMLAIAKVRVPDAIAIEGDMTQMEFEPERFDAVHARGSILHLTKSEAKKVIKDVYTILKRGGVVFCTLKEGEGEREISDDRYGSEGTRFFSFYSEKQARELFAQAGFENIETVRVVSRSKIPWVQVWAIK